MNLNRVVRVISLVSIIAGIGAVVAPASVADFFGLSLEPGQKLGWGEIGALYGGNFFGLGLVGLYAMRPGLPEGPILLGALGVVWVSIGTGRLLVLLTRAAEAASPFGWLSFALEVAVGACFLVAARLAPLDAR